MESYPSLDRPGEGVPRMWYAKREICVVPAPSILYDHLPLLHEMVFLRLRLRPMVPAGLQNHWSTSLLT